MPPVVRRSEDSITKNNHGFIIGKAGLPYRPDMRVAYNKLVRDKIPEIIQSDGRRAVTRVLDERSYRAALLAKLLEEANEAQEAPADDLPSELADVLEVIHALLTGLDMTWDQLADLADSKRTQRGGFQDRLFLEYVEEERSPAQG